jgi:oxygen-independent coproporphyrinogen-3 oxidase
MFEALAKVSFETVSMDFIFALPNQTIENLIKDIETAFNNGANHFAVYPFIDFSFTDRSFTKMTNGEKKKLLYEIVDYCEEKGYVRDSIWTFSKEGESKYSSMTRDNFLGFGCSATTLLEGQFKINTFDLEEYQKRISEDNLPTALTLYFSRRQRMIYYLFWTAYTMRVNPMDFQLFFSESLESNYGFELWLLRVLGFVKKVGNKYVMTTKGSYYYHYYENFYTLSYIDQMWNLMKNDALPKELVIK